MSQLFIIILIMSLFLTNASNAYAAVSGGIEYRLPIDYSEISEEEYRIKADSIFDSLTARETNEIDDNMTIALNLYSILLKKNPQNIDYAIKLGRLYDKIGKDRQAKGAFYHAIGLKESDPKAYFFLGEFFYRRAQYRRALKFYKAAYERGYQSHIETINKMKIIYTKFGDKSALEVLN